MRILALEKEEPGLSDDVFVPFARQEAAALWDLIQAGVVRETYFRTDAPEAVLLLECADLEAAGEALASLPYVRAGLIRFELIGLRPYPGFARLFASSNVDAAGAEAAER